MLLLLVLTVLLPSTHRRPWESVASSSFSASSSLRGWPPLPPLPLPLSAASGRLRWMSLLLAASLPSLPPLPLPLLLSMCADNHSRTRTGFCG